MNRSSLFSIIVLAFLVSGAGAQEPTPLPNADLERMSLENERMKLENERMQLEIEKMRIQNTQEKPESSKKDRKENAEDFLKAMAKKSAEMAKEHAEDATRMVLDFNNGEVWYKGIRHSIHDLPELYDHEGWEYKKRVAKRNANGVGRMLYAHRNISLLRYEGRDRGVFVWERPQEGEGLLFITPEGVEPGSAYGNYRNLFENDVYHYDKQKKKKKMRILKFKNPKGFFRFDDKLNFWFDGDDKLARIEWGVLDEN